jgi:hypothetical protein
LRGAANAWGPDGTWQWQWDVTGAKVPEAKRYVVTHQDDFVGERMDPHKLALLRRALAFVHDRGWRLVAFDPPYTTDSLSYLRHNPSTAGLFRDYEQRIPRLVASYGFPFADLADVRSVPCNESEFTWNDGAHADDRCSEKVRERLEPLLRKPP